jgi:hypothetical protein
MKRLIAMLLLACLAVVSLSAHADAQRRGGGGGRRGGGGGGFRGGGGGGMSRGGARTSVTSRPSRPSGGNYSRPATRPSTPAASRPSLGQGANRPSVSPPANRPNVGGGAAGGGNLANRPGGGANVGNGNRENLGNGNRTNVGNGNRTNISNDRPINVNDNDLNINGGHWDGGYGCCYGWGAAAAGFAAGAITAAAIGSTVYALPPSCPAYYYGGVTYNHCGGVWYEPQFQGTETTYVVVNAPEGAPAETTAPPPP